MAKKLSGLSGISHITCSERGNVLYHCIMPQCTDLTYIVTNGNFRIWLISRSYKDEIMYEIMFYVVQSCKSWTHIIVSLMSWFDVEVCIDALDISSSKLMLHWWARWVKVLMLCILSPVFPVVIVISSRSSSSSDMELVCYTGTPSRMWLTRLKALTEQLLSSYLYHLVWRWLKMSTLLPCGHMSQVIQDFNFKVCGSQRVRSVSLESLER